MVVWLKKPDGKCVRLTDKWKPRIHVGGDYRKLIDLACKSYVENSIFVDKFERAGDIEKSRVLEVVVENDAEDTAGKQLFQFPPLRCRHSLSPSLPLPERPVPTSPRRGRGKGREDRMDPERFQKNNRLQTTSASEDQTRNQD